MGEPSVIAGAPCNLCVSTGGELVWQNALCRVVAVADPDYPGFCRVILNRHAAEMSDLGEDERHDLMRVVFAVETALRGLVGPDKMNLASLGNLTAHVHWHIIPRWQDDRCFPNPIWGEARRRESAPRPVFNSARLTLRLAALLGQPAAPGDGRRS